MRERTLKMVGTSAAMLTGAFLVKDMTGILISTVPAVIGGFAGALFPEWDNPGTEFAGGPNGKSPALRLGNLLHGGNPVLADTRKKYLTEEERKLSAQTVGGLRYETRSLLAFAIAMLPFAALWLIFGAVKPLQDVPKDIVFGAMLGFGTGYLVNIVLTIISHGTFSRNGAKLLWPIIPLRICIPLVHSEELLPDGGGVKDRRGTGEKLFALVSMIGLVAAAVIVMAVKTDMFGLV